MNLSLERQIAGIPRKRVLRTPWIGFIEILRFRGRMHITDIAEERRRDEEDWWTLMTDRSSSGSKGCGGGVVLITQRVSKPTMPSCIYSLYQTMRQNMRLCFPDSE
ncbi:unnamed protein product [Cuscuta europaea]|uniref:Uncharacterized protein n=1 Tax=Cuscuta europaea TaxID=41803 RepID=A0A9P0ZCX7_CUSEU|nr:unnamed protein product [Cuscuta europaea]